MVQKQDLNSSELWNILSDEDDYILPKRIMEHSVFKLYKDKKITIGQLKEQLNIPITVVNLDDFEILSDFDKVGLENSQSNEYSGRVILHVEDDGYYERIVFNLSAEHHIDPEYIILNAIVTNFFVNLIEGLKEYDMENDFTGFSFDAIMYHYISINLMFDTSRIDSVVDEYVSSNYPFGEMGESVDEQIVQEMFASVVDIISGLTGATREMASLYIQVNDAYYS